MARVSIATLEKATEVAEVPGFASDGTTRALFDREKDPIHLRLHELATGDALAIGPMAGDCVLYVWEGAIVADGRTLVAGSSLVVEHGARIGLNGGNEGARLLSFAATRPIEAPREGGHVHAVPDELVPRVQPADPKSTAGGMHVDASCPTCTAWLHENRFPANDGSYSIEDGERGIHSHSEDEVIVVIGGTMRLGSRLYGPGTAVAVTADTLYSFTPGPDGLHFINFRPQAPGDISFRNGKTMDEVGYWKTLLGTPPAIKLAVA